MLSDYNRKIRVQAEIGELQNLLSGGKQRLTSAQAEGQVVINLERFENNAEACHKRIDELAWELENVAQNPNKKVSIADVSEMLRRLRHGKVRRTVLLMIHGTWHRGVELYIECICDGSVIFFCV